MTTEHLQKIVDERNAQLEAEAANNATSFINGIIQSQQRIKVEQERIAGYRKALQEITVSTVTLEDIMGEEGGE